MIAVGYLTPDPLPLTSAYSGWLVERATMLASATQRSCRSGRRYVAGYRAGSGAMTVASCGRPSGASSNRSAQLLVACIVGGVVDGGASHRQRCGRWKQRSSRAQPDSRPATPASPLPSAGPPPSGGAQRRSEGSKGAARRTRAAGAYRATPARPAGAPPQAQVDTARARSYPAPPPPPVRAAPAAARQAARVRRVSPR